MSELISRIKYETKLFSEITDPSYKKQITDAAEKLKSLEYKILKYPNGAIELFKHSPVRVTSFPSRLNTKIFNCLTKKERKKERQFTAATIFILLGIVLIFISILMDVFIKESHLRNIGLQLFSHIGIGSLVIGILGLLFDTEHWTKYFETRLSKIITEKEYLEKLDESALITLQTQVLTAYYKNNEIGTQDGFLNFYQKNIQTFINSPFRIDVKLHLQIDYHPNDNDKLVVNETMSWMCKKNGGRIQENISWEPSPGEYEDVNDFSLSLHHASLDGKTERFTHNKLEELNCLSEDKKGFHFSLDHKYQNLDQLFVTIKVNATIIKTRFIAWRMSHPTRRMSLTVQFPKELKVVTELFFNENNLVNIESETDGYFYLNIEDWIMPDEGISLQLLSKNNQQQLTQMQANSPQDIKSSDEYTQ